MLENQNSYYFILDESGKVVDAKLFSNVLEVNDRIKQLKEQYPTSKFVSYEIYEFFYHKYS